MHRRASSGRAGPCRPVRGSRSRGRDSDRNSARNSLSVRRAPPTRLQVLEALRRGERSPLTAMYFLLRQRELRRGAIEAPTYKLLPKPPPPRQPAQRRRPVPANLRAAAARLPAEPLPEITHKLQLTGLGVQKPPRAAAGARGEPARAVVRTQSDQRLDALEQVAAEGSGEGRAVARRTRPNERAEGAPRRRRRHARTREDEAAPLVRCARQPRPRALAEEVAEVMRFSVYLLSHIFALGLHQGASEAGRRSNS